jgi:very-short-patch-repair endonuclease
MSRPRTAGVLGHRALETPTISFRGLPVTQPEWLLLELASILTVDELIVAGDGLVRRKRALSTLGQLQATAVTLDGRNIRKVRTAIRDVRSGTDSPMETRLRLLLIRARLPEPVTGYTIRNANGDFVGTPDLCYVEQRIAIEYEGAVHRDDPRVFAEDILRRELMQEADWYVIRVISDHVFRTPQWLVTRIARILAQRTPR